MTNIRNHDNLSYAQDKTPDFGNCKGCHTALKPPFYQYYHIDPAGKNYKSGSISSAEELARYTYLANKKWEDAYSSGYIPSEDFSRLMFEEKLRLCSLCYIE